MSNGKTGDMEKIQELLKNKTILYSAIGATILVVVLLIVGIVMISKPKDKAQT